MVTFYKLNDNGEPGAPVLYLDTLKVSTIEQTAENTSARGGKGNPELIMWDYGKEITVTLEDALFSAKSMALMFGDETYDAATTQTIKKTVAFEGTAVPTVWYDPQGGSHSVTGATYYNALGESVASASLSAGEKYFATFNVNTTGMKIDINPDKFPGTYYVTGDTYARSEVSGEDEFFQFVIRKAKIQSEVTLTMEAEGDPSTFSMNLKVLRPADKSKAMMELIKYTVAAG